MNGEYQYTDLDPELLSTPFKVQTNWHVLEGAACCGKTTMIDLLADRGYKTIPEAGRMIIDQELAKGRKISDIIGSNDAQYQMMAKQLVFENGLKANETVFLDRALPGFITFHRLKRLNINEVLADCFQFRYASVFILDMLPYQLDGARVDDEKYKGVLDNWLERDYSALGYKVIRVPVLPPQERVQYILNTLKTRDLISTNED